MLDFSSCKNRQERIYYLSQKIDEYYLKIENKTMKRSELIELVLCIRKKKKESEFY